MVKMPNVLETSNLEWVKDNEEVFKDYLVKNHSIMSLAVALIHNDLFCDSFIEEARSKIEESHRRILIQEGKIKSKIQKLNKAQKKIQEEKETVVKEVEKKIKEELEMYDLPEEPKE